MVVDVFLSSCSGQAFGDRKLFDGFCLVFFIIKVTVKELEENPLRPFVIPQVGGSKLAVPVIAEAERLDLLSYVIDIFPVWTAYCSAGRPKAS